MMKKSLVRSVLLTAALGLLILPAMADGPTMTIVGPWEADGLYLNPNGGTLDVEIRLSGFTEGLAAFATQLEFVGDSSADPNIALMGHTEGDAENLIADSGLGLTDTWAGLYIPAVYGEYQWPWPIIGAQSVESAPYVVDWTSEPDRRTIGILNVDDPETVIDPVFADDTLVITIKYDYASAAVGTYTIGAIAGETMFVSTGEAEIAVTVVPGTAVVRPGSATWPTVPGDATLTDGLTFADVSYIYGRMTGGLPGGADPRVGDGWRLDVNGDNSISFADVSWAYGVMTGAIQP